LTERPKLSIRARPRSVGKYVPHSGRSEIVQVEVRTRSIVGTHLGGEVHAQADASSGPCANTQTQLVSVGVARAGKRGKAANAR
jgi:hypothetical protein